MVRFQHVRGLMLAGAALAAAQAAPLWAQDQSATPTDQGSGESIKTTKTDNGEIIVTAKHFVPDGAQTANKSDIPLIQTPQSISVITRDQIDLLSFVDAQQAVRYVAGVTGENYGPDPRFDFITVRGFTPKQYIDGLAVPATTTIFTTGVDIYGFQSLEVLKGPSSTLYGAAPPGGILNETLRRPSSHFGGEFELKGGTQAYKEAAGTVTGAATDWLDLGFTGLYRDTHGYIDYQRVRRIYVAPAATIKLGPDTKLTLLSYYQHDEDLGGAGGFLPAYGTLLPNPNGQQIKRSTNLDSPNTEYDRTQYSIGYDFEQRFGGIKFRSNTKYTHYHEDTPIGVYSGVGYTNTDDPADPTYYRQVGQFNFPSDELVKAFTTDNRIEGKLDTGPLTHNFVVGVDYRNVKNVAAFGFTGAGTLDVFNPVYNFSNYIPVAASFVYNDERLKQTGTYGQDQIGLGNLYLTLGGRYDWVKVKYFGAPQKQHKFTYRAGATYVTSAGIAPYVSYSTSFEPVLGTDATTTKAFKPTSVKQIEGGVKYDGRTLPGNIKISATAAVFDIKEKNFVAAQASPTPAFSATQGGLVDVWGAEFELVARISEQLTINAAYSYSKSKVKSSANNPGDVGFELPNTPRNKLAVFADYTAKSGFLAGFGGGFGVRYNSNSAGSLPSGTAIALNASTPVYTTGKVTLYDAILHYDVPGWRFSVNGSNIFDKRYVARCTGLYQCIYGAGRQVLGTITKRF